MAREVIQDVRYTCDICKEERAPIRDVSITVGYALGDSINIDISVRADVPYIESNDVCQECLNKALIQYLKSQGVEFK